MSAGRKTLSGPLGGRPYGGTVTSRIRPRKPPAQPLPRVHRPVHGAAYRRLVVALSPGGGSQAVRVACELAGDRSVSFAAVAVIEVPLEEPLETPDRDAEAAAREAVREAQAVGSLYGLSVEGVVLHAREAGEALVAEAADRRAQVVVVASAWPRGRGRRGPGRTTTHVLERCPCRVLLIADVDAAPSDPVFRGGSPSAYWPSGDFVDPDGSTSR